MSPASVITRPSVTNMHTAETPPESPLQSSPQPSIFLKVTQNLVDKLQLLVPSKTVVEGSSEVQITEIPTVEDSKPTEARRRASKVDYKNVNEVWDKKASSYTIAEPAASATAVDELDQYLFIHRIRIDRKTLTPTSYVDVKSKELQKVLMEVLADVRGISLREDKPTIEANLLFNFLPELKLYRTDIENDTTSATSHLQVLLGFIESSYASTKERLQSLLRNNEITYDLLWALFKPNSEIYTTCPGTEKPMCVMCNHGEEKVRMNGAPYFSLEARNFDYDGKVFGEATVKIAIEKFRGAKQIDLLQSFPLRYHGNSIAIRRSLIECGRTFVSLIGKQHHKQYHGQAFWKDDKGEIKSVPVSSRIMVDAAFFRRVNPNYDTPQVGESSWSFFWESAGSNENRNDIKNSEVPLHELGYHDLLVCSPTVLGFSLNDKQWLEFAVANISDIDFDSSSFDHLALPWEKKEVIHALSKIHLSQDSNERFADVFRGRGKGLLFLLHGPPGVGKTLTAEALSEHLQRPLYMISAGELGINADALEKGLTKIFEIASHWKAVLLLDEADVFVEERATRDVVRNALVSVFLRKLEYYEGILFLTTNRVTTFDEAIASRVHLPLRYDNLDQLARRQVWEGLLERAKTRKGGAVYTAKNIEELAERHLNGREIKNAVLTAQALAAHEASRIRLSHLEKAMAFNKQFQYDFRGAGQIENMHSYQ